MRHEEVVLEWFPVETERPTAPAALRARLARLAGLAVPPTRPRRLEEPEHLGFALAPHRADQGVATHIDRGRAGEIRAVEAFQERDVAGALSFTATAATARARRRGCDPCRRPRGSRGTSSAGLACAASSVRDPGSSSGEFHFTSIVMPRIDEIFGSLVIGGCEETAYTRKRNSYWSAPRQNLFYLVACKALAHWLCAAARVAYNCC